MIRASGAAATKERPVRQLRLRRHARRRTLADLTIKRAWRDDQERGRSDEWIVEQGGCQGSSTAMNERDWCGSCAIR